nr:MAG: hypothetical protein [Bacteriophage sp.]
MAKKKKEVELKEVSRTEINGAIIIKYEDGSVKIIPAPIMLSAEEAEDLFGSESDDEEEEEEEEESDDDDDDDDGFYLDHFYYNVLIYFLTDFL